MIRQVDGIPRWFAYLAHHWKTRRCRKIGHEGTPVHGGCCTRCGLVWFTDD